MKRTFLQLSTALVLTLSACGGGEKGASSSLDVKIRDEQALLEKEHHDIEADHSTMEKEFRSLDAKYRAKVKNPDSTYIKFVTAHEDLLKAHENLIISHKGLLENLSNKEGKSEKELEEALKNAITRDKETEEAHKKARAEHDKFTKDHEEMLKKASATEEKK